MSRLLAKYYISGECECYTRRVLHVIIVSTAVDLCSRKILLCYCHLRARDPVAGRIDAIVTDDTITVIVNVSYEQ